MESAQVKVERWMRFNVMTCQAPPVSRSSWGTASTPCVLTSSFCYAAPSQSCCAWSARGRPAVVAAQGATRTR